MYMQGFNIDYREEMSTKIKTVISQRFGVNAEGLGKVLDVIMLEYSVDKECTGLVVSDVMERLEMYVAVKRLEGLTKGTLENYYREIKNFSEHIIMPLNSMTTMDLRRYLITCYNDSQPSTYNSKVSILKTFFAWLHSEGYIDKNPAIKLKRNRNQGRVRKPIKKDDLEEMISKAKNPREEAMLNFMYATGCRVSEVVGVNKKDIDWNDNSLYVIGKGDKERKVFFSARAKTSLLKYIGSRCDSSKALFVSFREPYGRLGRDAMLGDIKAMGKRVGSDGINTFCHLIRHTTISDSLNAGMSLSAVQDLAGHSNPTTTRIYGKITDTYLKQEYAKL